MKEAIEATSPNVHLEEEVIQRRRSITLHARRLKLSRSTGFAPKPLRILTVNVRFHIATLSSAYPQERMDPHRAKPPNGPHNHHLNCQEAAACRCRPQWPSSELINHGQPAAFLVRVVDAGCFFNNAPVRRGRMRSSPLQVGHLPPSGPSAHDEQNVHSNEQIRASLDSGGRSLSQHSQFGRNSSISFTFRRFLIHVLSGYSHSKVRTRYPRKTAARGILRGQSCFECRAGRS